MGDDVLRYVMSRICDDDLTRYTMNWINDIDDSNNKILNEIRKEKNRKFMEEMESILKRNMEKKEEMAIIEIEGKMNGYIFHRSRAYKELCKDSFVLTRCRMITAKDKVNAKEPPYLYITLGQLGLEKPNMIVIRLYIGNEDIDKVDLINDSGTFNVSCKTLADISNFVGEVRAIFHGGEVWAKGDNMNTTRTRQYATNARRDV